MLLQTIPLALLHPLFGRFLDIAAGKAGHPAQQDYEMVVSIGSATVQDSHRQDAPGVTSPQWMLSKGLESLTHSVPS